uniref:uncharacterized protein LOC120340360 n=1 Tax=Styela clava TaxID=7725 RepID=UPI00193ACCE5|nr:uncharacterized protein LOC120340360 [Styela clava]
MYLRVILDSRDRDAMRFLWYPNDDLGKKPIDLRMCSHVFGATSSPSIASFVLKRVADDNLTNADLETIQTVRRSFFVDDGVKSKRTVNETLQLINQLIELLASGGFCLTKFACNKIEVMEAIPEADRSTATKALDFSTELTERTLGIYWNMVHDVFKVRVEIEFRPSTRRGMLSMLGQVYDPLGFIQPFLIPAKRILQDLCFLGYSWDDPVEGDLYDGWEKWISTLPSLRELTIQRCYKPEGFEAANVQLHCFCDASRVGYGAVAYLRLENESGEVHCAFVKGTARVTPKKLVTIPRLELTAAVVATEVAHSVTNALDYEIHEICYWTDSMTVLQMLNSRSQRFKTFVANRVNIIQSISDVSQWSHVPTNENPADIASRGLMPDKLDKAKLWFQGPSFLWQQSVSWPGTSSVSDTIPTNSDLHCEIKVNLVEVQKRSQYFPELINRYSTWEKLSRTIAWMLRFKFFILWKTCRSNDSPMTGDLTVTELSVATIQICKLAQIESFSPELEYFSERVHDGPNYLSSGYNGTNFVAGERLLAEGICKWNQSQISNSLSQHGIQWDFQPPLAPHQNGLVEIMVREAKRVLYAICAKSRTFTDFSLISMLTGVERILNDRPLTPISDDARDLEVLTPNSILTGNLDPSIAPISLRAVTSFAKIGDMSSSVLIDSGIAGQRSIYRYCKRDRNGSFLREI